MEDLRELAVAQELHEEVYMVGHDDVLVEGVSLTVEMVEGVFDDFCDFWVAKYATSVSGIEKVFYSFGEEGVVFDLLFGRK